MAFWDVFFGFGWFCGVGGGGGTNPRLGLPDPWGAADAQIPGRPQKVPVLHSYLSNRFEKQSSFCQI
jgi:hypothetical protein